MRTTALVAFSIFLSQAAATGMPHMIDDDSSDLLKREDYSTSYEYVYVTITRTIHTTGSTDFTTTIYPPPITEDPHVYSISTSTSTPCTSTTTTTPCTSTTTTTPCTSTTTTTPCTSTTTSTPCKSTTTTTPIYHFKNSTSTLKSPKWTTYHTTVPYASEYISSPTHAPGNGTAVPYPPASEGSASSMGLSKVMGFMGAMVAFVALL